MSYRGYGIQGVFALEKLGERDTGFLLRTSQFSTVERVRISYRKHERQEEIVFFKRGRIFYVIEMVCKGFK